MCSRFLKSVFILFLVLLSRPVFAGENNSVTVFAAASLTDAMTEIREAYADVSPADVYLNFSGSNTLRFQIEKGAPCDVYISADPLNVERLNEKGMVRDGSIFPLLANRLVVVIHKDDGQILQDLHELIAGRKGLVALGDPVTVPAGIYAKQAFQSAGLWEDLRPYVVPVIDVRAALAQVERRNTRYAVVYQTDAMISDQIQVAYKIPEDYHKPVRYVAALIRPSRGNVSAEAVIFYEFLKGDVARAIFSKYGFQPL